jgi:hypothetical protein
MKPNRILFLTTPNGSRVRNILHMLTGRNVLDNFRYPDSSESLGHQHEYVLPQMMWQLERAGMRALSAKQYEALHVFIKPANLIPHLRNGLMIAARPSGCKLRAEAPLAHMRRSTAPARYA